MLSSRTTPPPATGGSPIPTNSLALASAGGVPAPGITKEPVMDIAKLLDHPAADRRIAAAIVIAELGLKGKELVDGLLNMVESGQPALQLPALGALAQIGGQRAVPRL